MSSNQGNRGGLGAGAAPAREQSAGNTEPAGGTYGAATARTGEGQTTGAEAPNFGSARSDYGSHAYGGRLDEAGLEEGGDARTYGETSGRTYAGETTSPQSGSGGFSWNTVFMLLAGMGIGAAIMYALDPDQGRRRRALARDKIVRASNTTGRAISGTARDLRNRAQGVIHETGKRFGFGGNRGAEQQQQGQGQDLGGGQEPGGPIL